MKEILEMFSDFINSKYSQLCSWSRKVQSRAQKKTFKNCFQNSFFFISVFIFHSAKA